MIIILSGADGSNCGLGQIDIPVPMQDETLAILAKQTRYGENDYQTIALNKFIYELKQANLWSKVGMFLPLFMSHSIEELSYDAISDNYLQQTTASNTGYNASENALTGLCDVPVTKNLFGNFFVGSKHTTADADCWMYLTNMTVENGIVLRGSSHGYAGFRTSKMEWCLTNAALTGFSEKYNATDQTAEHANGKLGPLFVTNHVANPITDTKMNVIKSPVVVGSYNIVDWSSFAQPNTLKLGTRINANKSHTVDLDFYLIGNNTSLTISEQETLYASARKLRLALEHGGTE